MMKAGSYRLETRNVFKNLIDSYKENIEKQRTEMGSDIAGIKFNHLLYSIIGLAIGYGVLAWISVIGAIKQRRNEMLALAEVRNDGQSRRG